MVESVENINCHLSRGISQEYISFLSFVRRYFANSVAVLTSNDSDVFINHREGQSRW